MTQVHYHATDLAFDRGWISDAALQVVGGLQDAGFDGYLVGGCVRDLLLQRRPKDFDITTDASPEQVRKLFRRSRIIGRRFKLVHVRFGREVIEVATYRAKPDGASARRGGGHGNSHNDRGRVVDDNVFGTIEQDARRRDFTINALYYDPTRELVVDFLGGVKDARKNTLRVIGDARERFTEDPVRMLRSLRFRAKLGLEMEDGLADAIADCVDLLADVPPARLFDEAKKMFHYGHALNSWNELRAHGLLEKLFPMTAEMLANPAHHSEKRLIEIALTNTDHRVAQDKPVIAAFLFAVLLWRPFRTVYDRVLQTGVPPADAAWQAGDEIFARQSRCIGTPRRVSAVVIEIWQMQFMLEARRPRTVENLLAHRRFRAAYDCLLLRAQVGDADETITQWWTDIQEHAPHEQQQMIDELRASHSPQKHRRGHTNKKSPARA